MTQPDPEKVREAIERCPQNRLSAYFPENLAYWWRKYGSSMNEAARAWLAEQEGGMVLPDGYDVYVMGRDYENGYWLEIREIESGKLARDIGMRIVHAPTIEEVFAKARAMIAAAPAQDSGMVAIPQSMTDYITLRNEGAYKLIVEYNGKEIIREHFESGGSEIHHTYHLSHTSPTDKNGWMPIESAPRDGTKLLLCVPGEQMDYKKGSVARIIGYFASKFTLPMHEDVCEPEKYPDSFDYQESSGEWFAKEGFYTFTFENNYGDEIGRKVTPTHWQPLPPPPALDKGE